jgi:tetratricopeptide (TPR) repeat protein
MNYKKNIANKVMFFALFGLLLNKANAQQLHAPNEVLDIIQRSKLGYEIGILTTKMPTAKGPILDNSHYLAIEDSLNVIKSFSAIETDEVRKLREQANNALAAARPDYKAARKAFNKILEKFPQHAEILTEIGNTYTLENKHDEAKKQYLKALEINPRDYYARWMLSEILFKEGDTEKAIREITLAHLYNRNMPRLQATMLKMYEANNCKCQDWTFNPQYKLSSTKKNITIDAKDIWMAYAMYKALWAYEPGYKEMMLAGSKTDLGIMEETESVFGLVTTYTQQNKIQKVIYPELAALEEALEQSMIEPYALYEVVLVKRPLTALYLEEDYLRKLIKYIATIRCPKA